MKEETAEERSKRILAKLRSDYPGKDCYDLDGRGQHFVCEIEPVADHPEYDRAIEVIITSQPHKHQKMTQTYKVHSGILELYVGKEKHVLNHGDTFVVQPGSTHWSRSDDEALVEIYSEPGWTKEDHIVL